MKAGWELPTVHYRISAVEKAIDRAQATLKAKPSTRHPLKGTMLQAGRERIVTMMNVDTVSWMGLALSYFSLCRASELWAHDDGLVHADVCWTETTSNYLEFQ